MEINFFKKSNFRNPSERKKLLETEGSEKVTNDYLSFGYDYFDNKGSWVGYQGYHYDGRFGEAVEKLIKHYNLKRGFKILEIGCAKGYLLVEFAKRGMDVYGIDLSQYAVENCHPDLKKKIQIGNAERINFPDQYFDFVLTKELLPHIHPNKIQKVLSEIKRVAKGKSFHLIQCGRNKKELELMARWDKTHQTMLTPKEWKALFKKVKLNADFQFKILFPLNK